MEGPGPDFYALKSWCTISLEIVNQNPTLIGDDDMISRLQKRIIFSFQLMTVGQLTTTTVDENYGSLDSVQFQMTVMGGLGWQYKMG